MAKREIAEGDAEADLTSVLTLSDAVALKAGKYMVKMTVTVPAGGELVVKDRDGLVSKSTTSSGTFYFGPFTVVGTEGRFTVVARHAGTATFSVASVHVLLPYVEVMNMSRIAHDMTDMKLEVEDASSSLLKRTVATSAMTLHAPLAAANWANGEALTGMSIPRHKAVSGGFDTAKTYGPHGVWYGFFLYVYDAEAFERQFQWGNQDGTWGNHAAENFPLVEVTGKGGSQDVFYHGWDGTQKVRLLSQDNQLVAGGPIDFWTDRGAFPCQGVAALSSNALAAGRTYAAGDLWFAVINRGFNEPFSIETVSDADPSKTTSPGRWNHNGRVRPSTTTNDSWLSWVENVSWPSGGAETRREQVDAVSISDAGYFKSPGELTQLSLHKWPMATVALLRDNWETTDWASRWQPNFVELMAFTVASRSYARININTASDAALAAVFVGTPSPAADTITAKRNYLDWRSLLKLNEFTSAYYGNGLDSDGHNDGDDDSERSLWYVHYGNLVTLRSHVFKIRASGQVRRANGDVLAKSNIEAVFDRGSRLDPDTGQPMVKLLYKKTLPPGDN